MNKFQICNVEMFYQPKVNLKTNDIEGVEALARFIDKNEKYINTEKVFLEVNNEEDIVYLDKYLIGRVLEDLLELKYKTNKIINTSINLSTKKMESINFREDIEGLFLNHENFIKFIEFEITEYFEINNTIKIKNEIEFLHEKGFKVSIDDLGSKYNKFDLIDLLCVDTIKIDRNIINNMNKNKYFLKTIIDKAHDSNIKVIAEGVEDRRTYEELKDISCDAIQGFYIYEPMSLNCLIDLINTVESLSITS
ncbi:EAL domain-containing protein [Faecalimicrobium sp. JNUCC 81]